MEKRKTKTNIRYFLLFLMLTIILSLATGCGRSASATKDGKSLSLTYDEIDSEGRVGIFVLNKDKTFSPVIPDMPGYESGNDIPSNARYVWYTDNQTDVTSLIPVATQNTPLVAIYNSSGEMPEEWFLEKYEDKGYTIGMHVDLDEEKNMLIMTEDTLDGSSANKAVSNMTSNTDEVYRVNSVSGSDTLPINNVDANMGILLGMQKNKLYTFDFFRGTKTETLDVYADTRIFQSSRYINLEDPYKRTSQGYFVINLPINLETGYYYISDIGFFKYERQ